MFIYMFESNDPLPSSTTHIFITEGLDVSDGIRDGPISQGSLTDSLVQIKLCFWGARSTDSSALSEATSSLNVTYLLE